MLGLSYASSLSPRLESKLATLFTPSPSRVGHPGDPYRRSFARHLVELYGDVPSDVINVLSASCD